MTQIIGNGLIILGLLFTAFGLFGVFRFDGFFARVLVAANVDTVGFITILFGVMVLHGLSPFTAKLAVILLAMVIVTPLITHSITRSAYFSGHRELSKHKKDQGEKNGMGD